MSKFCPLLLWAMDCLLLHNAIFEVHLRVDISKLCTTKLFEIAALEI